MSALLASSTSRPLPLIMRADLIARRQSWQGREYWTIKDPLQLRYYRFEEEEFAILSMLDGQTSSDAIRERFEQQFAPQSISAAQLQHLLAVLHRSNLVISSVPGQGAQLHARGERSGRQRLIGTLANFLSIRLRGVDPDRFLTWLNGWAGWIFSPSALCGALTLIVSALLLIAAEFDTFQSRLPSFEAFFAARNWLWLAVTLCLTKVLHELGHGLSCKRFGGECHEMGVMLLVFTPCLYCNVSDAWMIKSKWRRAAIGAAGMYVELILASLATFLWWFSQPGLLNHLCLNVMFVSSVSTLLFNANPLMRFDGYYILADLLEIPNLRQKASAVIQRKLGAWILGLRERPDPFLPQRRRWLFALFAVASSAYGWVVSLSIFWFLYQVLEPYGLKLLGQCLAAGMVLGLVVMPLARLSRFLLEPTRAQDVKKVRALVITSGVLATLAALLALPLPHYVFCSFEVQPRGGQSVYVDVPGELRQVLVSEGPVAQGAVLARLDDVDMRLAAERLLAQHADLTVRIEGIRRRAHVDDQALLELAHTEEALAALERQVARLAEETAKLTIRAPQAGLLVPPPSRVDRATDRTQLAHWTGRPLQARNIGAYLEASTLVCRIAQPGQFEAILAIDQQDLDFVQAGQPADLHLSSLPGKVHAGRIERIAEENMRAAPTRLAVRGGGNLATQADHGGVERPLDVLYQASVPLDDDSGLVVIGATGTARVHAGYRSLGSRLWRGLCQTFHFEM